MWLGKYSWKLNKRVRHKWSKWNKKSYLLFIITSLCCRFKSITWIQTNNSQFVAQGHLQHLKHYILQILDIENRFCIEATKCITIKASICLIHFQKVLISPLEKIVLYIGLLTRYLDLYFMGKLNNFIKEHILDA